MLPKKKSSRRNELSMLQSELKVRLCTHLSFREFLALFSANPKSERISMRDLIEIYERETGKKLTSRAYQKAVRQQEKAGLFRVERYEQLWIRFYATPPNRSELKKENSMLGLYKRTPKKIHEAHKIKLSFEYRGKQPEDGLIKSFGRYRTAKQVIYRISDKITIAVYKKRMNVWVHRPRGVLTRDQLINAQAEGREVAAKFAKKRNLELLGFTSRLLQSHHVIIDKQLNEALKPTFKKHGEEIENRIGSKICPSSHKGKIEHEGKKRKDRLVLGSEVAGGLEYLTLDFKDEFREHNETERRYHESIALYDMQIRKHLKVLEEISKTLKSIRKERI